jgi:DNA-binding PadR family transcriptional regulator
VEIEKGYEGRRARTWIHLTAAGEQALHDEISQLKRLIRQVEDAPGTEPAAGPSSS